MAGSTGGAGEYVDLDITGVAHGGVFVGRHEGRVVFVPDTMPGERVRVRLTETSKSAFWRGEAIEVLDASLHRIPHIWRQADIGTPPEQRPGGADFGHIALAHQRELKVQVLLESLQRIGGIDDIPVAIEEALPLVSDAGDVIARESPDGTAWRTRVSLHVDAGGRIGPFAARSHSVIALDELPLATAAVERAALELTGGTPGRIDLVQPADGEVRIIARPEREQRSRARRGPDRGRPRQPAPASEPDAAREVIVERVGAREFRVDAGGFWQVHRLAAHSLSQLVSDGLRGLDGGSPVDPDAWHLDLYGGVGLFAATLGLLGGTATRVTSVESDQRATEHAAENLAEWAGARAETARVDRWVAKASADASLAERTRLARGVVVLDPPRSGVGREVVEGVADLEPATVVYVACDPVALARDLATFRPLGYDIVSIRAVDMFPNSHHLEAIAVLTRATPPR